MNKFKAAAIGSILIACGLSFSACSEETENENDKPEIYDQVEQIYNELNGRIKCDEIESYVSKHKLDNVKLSKACDKYKESLVKTAGNSVDKLIKNFDNSGYYLAMYLLLHKLNDQIADCTPGAMTTTATSAVWEDLFEHNNCNGLVEEADNVAKKRGNK